jgi:hypothetical protein
MSKVSLPLPPHLIQKTLSKSIQNQLQVEKSECKPVHIFEDIRWLGKTIYSPIVAVTFWPKMETLEVALFPIVSLIVHHAQYPKQFIFIELLRF